MKLYTCTDHDGHWVGVASVIVAEDETAARGLLQQALIREGLNPHSAFTLSDWSLERPMALILQNGEY